MTTEEATATVRRVCGPAVRTAAAALAEKPGTVYAGMADRGFAFRLALSATCARVGTSLSQSTLDACDWSAL